MYICIYVESMYMYNRTQPYVGIYTSIYEFIVIQALRYACAPVYVPSPPPSLSPSRSLPVCTHEAVYIYTCYAHHMHMYAMKRVHTHTCTYVHARTRTNKHTYADAFLHPYFCVA